ncbi:MAG TPA: S8 family serine peptidase [Opitutaceae bacterium]|nr:S8 family serine peptidase [Opitutaceae bacterium]
MKRTLLILVGAVALAFTGLAFGEKPKVTSQDELPRFTYEFKGDVTAVLTSDDEYAQLAPKVRADLERLLSDYDIQDRTTVQGIHGSLLSLDLIDGKYDSALEHIAVMRELEEKPSSKLLTGLLASALIEARRATEYPDDAAFRTAFKKAYESKINALPWDVVGEDLKQAKGSAEIVTEALVLGNVQASFQPGVDKNGTISGDIAAALVGSRSTVRNFVPLKAERIAVLTAFIEANRVEKADIWAARNFDLGPDESLTPVIVGVWDSGVDLPIFAATGGVNEAAPGIAFDLKSEPVTELLFPLTPEQLERYPESKAFTKGLQDLRASVDSPQAAALRKRMSELKQEEVKDFFEELSLFANYTHGTHVAGISTAGNPAARLIAARITFDHKMIPDVPTLESVAKEAASMRATVEYLRASKTRVVNMSWGGDARGYEIALEMNGAGGTPEERKALARQMFVLTRDALTAVMAAAPEVLFVVAAGNSDNDVGFDEVIPSGIDLPNILTVGAVDMAGDETNFTSHGASVDVHANGYEVDSFLPGGDREKYSGTSMASPNVTNLAAKLLAIDPTLTPTDVSELIIGGAERTADGRRNLINPRKSLELLKARKGA